MDEPAPGTSEEKMLQILVTEHSNLQSIRSGTIFEANGRTNIFLGTVSSVVIALAFIGQVTEMSGAFTLFALILLPSLLFIGVVTYVRVEQAGVEDMLASRSINRIRNYYTQIAPESEKFFVLSKHDDMDGMLWNMGIPPSEIQMLVSAAGLISVINGILAAVFISLLILTVFQAAPLLCMGIGVVVFALCVWLSYRYQGQRFNAVNSRLKVLYPSNGNDAK